MVVIIALSDSIFSNERFLKSLGVQKLSFVVVAYSSISSMTSQSLKMLC